ncbi:hypothetical protein M885DRAFT_566648 [Pelagophyceae sp. CCMP2097]|nr:hypothetical protein M885DRAFT_566648 [Pelagophyceae sp. CCMP2097]
MRSFLVLAALGFASALVPQAAFPRTLLSTATRPVESSAVVLEASRRNTKKEKRQRNYENSRKYMSRAPVQRGPRKKALSRKKLMLKDQSMKEKERETKFMGFLFLSLGENYVEEKLDLGRSETRKAFDLLDALTRCGALPLDCCALHAVVEATHCFDDLLIDTLIVCDSDPVEDLERASLVIAAARDRVARLAAAAQLAGP